MSLPQHRFAESSYDRLNDPRQDFGQDYATLVRGTVPAKNGGGGRRAPRRAVVGVGVAVLVLLCILPVWNATLLLLDGNFVFFLGRAIPLSIILMSITIILLYTITVLLFFKFGQQEFQTEQTVVMISTIFVTLLGLSLLLIALPFWFQTQGVYKDLRQHCGSSPSTARLFEYYEVLLAIRKTPACAQKLTVKECTGYADSDPYTGFLEYLEGNLMCSGFCQGPTNVLMANAPPAEPVVTPGPLATVPPQVAQAASGPIVYPTRAPQALVDTAEPARPLGLLSRHTGRADALALAGTETSIAVRYPYPPTLFSDANYRVSCDGAMSRNMKSFAQDIAAQLSMHGLVLLLIAVGAGFLKLVGLCRGPVNGDRIK